MPLPPGYRLYIDESGDHAGTDSTEIGKRYLGLAGVMFERQQSDEFHQALEQVKRTHLPYDPDSPPILHRKDILARRGAYRVLLNEESGAAFDRDLLSLIDHARFRVVAVVIDKVEHGQKKYRTLGHPYHYAMHAMLERYCGWLQFIHATGDVMAESRGGTEDRALRDAYESVHSRGTRYTSKETCQRTLTSRQVKLKPKSANVAGLQLADILAHPLARDVLVSYGRLADHGGDFAEAIARLVEPKYNCQHYTGRIQGYGRVLLA